MTSKQKNSKLLCFCSLILVLMIAVYATILSLAQATSASYYQDLGDRVSLDFGQRLLLPATSQKEDYLYLELSPDDSFQVSFLSDQGRESLIVNSGIWTQERTEDGAVPILHFLPDYVAQSGYTQVEIMPIGGDGDFFIQDLAFYPQEEDCTLAANLIDFEIKHYHIELEDEAYQVILDNRAQAIALGILHTDEESVVPGKVTAEGGSYSADIRLKGDWVDHLVGDQWSYRIELQGDTAIWGLQKFSLQPIETRNGLWEYLIYQWFREQGGVALRYDFADVTINGVYLGVFAVEEFTEKRVIENSQNREGPILKYNEGPFWISRSYYSNIQAPYRDYVVASQNKTTQSETLNSYASYAITALNKYFQGEIPASQVFDLDKYTELYAILDIFTAFHGRLEHNMRQYYNPVTTKIEPIPFDENANPGRTSVLFFSDGQVYLSWEQEVLASPGQQDYAAETLLRLAQDYPRFIQEQLPQIQQFITTIQRGDPSFTMDVWAVQPRLDQILALETPTPPRAELSWEGEEYQVTIRQENPVSLQIQSLEIFSAQGTLLHQEGPYTLAVDLSQIMETQEPQGLRYLLGEQPDRVVLQWSSHFTQEIFTTELYLEQASLLGAQINDSPGGDQLLFYQDGGVDQLDDSLSFPQKLGTKQVYTRGEVAS